MANSKKIVQAAAGAGGEALNVEEVFSTYVAYKGSGTSTVDQGIDMSGEGGMWWGRIRNNSGATGGRFEIHDTERGAGNYVRSDSNAVQVTSSFNFLSTFTSTGYTGWNGVSGYEVVSWSFRKAPKFFDVVQYVGDRTSGNLTLNHSLGSEPGVIFIKCLDDTQFWSVYHRSEGANRGAFLDLTNAFGALTDIPSTPTSTQFTIGTDSRVNFTGRNYIAYLFAHNDGDGGFGPDADQDIIKCGSFTGTGAAGNEIDLGFEPQWLLVKRTDSAQEWRIFDVMRGLIVDGPNYSPDAELIPNDTLAENSSFPFFSPTATGFVSKGGNANNSGGTFIYIAIRRGPMGVPENASDVFSVDYRTSNLPEFKSGFAPDFALRKFKTGGDHRMVTRLLGETKLETNLTAAESTYATDGAMDFSNGWGGNPGASTDIIAHTWGRAPNFCDAVAYTGNNTAGHAVPHNLGVTPEMVWVKERNDSVKWYVFMPSILGTSSALTLNDTNAAITVDSFTAYDETNLYFSGDGDVNGTSPYIAYLFASLDGVSKVGSYTGTNSTLNIDCGFSSGSSLVLIKRTDSTSPWWLWDSLRGITSGSDPWFDLNSNAGQTTGYDWLDPLSSGFSIPSGGNNNVSGASYIFYAVAI